ncbi:MAG: uroporphyrinogen decarboxylase family protein [Desulfobaccales bacterium]
MGMTHRERLLRALNHQEPDRVPIDLGGTYASSIALDAYVQLTQYLNLRDEPQVMRKWASAVKPDEKVLKALDIDTRMVVPRYDASWNEYWRLTALPDPNTFLDEWGVPWTKPEKGPSFISKHPLAGELTLEDVERFPWPNPDDPERYKGLKEQAKRLREETDFAVAGVFPRPPVSLSQFIRGYQDWFLDMGMNHPIIEAIMDHILDVDLKIGERVLAEIGKYVDVMFVHDDLATQESLMCSPKTYRKIIKPRHKKIFDFIKTHSDAKILYHCDGAIAPLLDDFIEIGVDALNPVQISAAGMDTAGLKEKFGDRLSFWGAIDTHTILPQGSVAEVRQEVKKQIECLGKNGGYVLAAVHNIQKDVPPENVVAMFKAAREFGVNK